MEFLLQFEHFLNEEGLKYLERCKTYTIECLNKDLLIKVLGNIEIKDIRNIPLVCKFWNTLFGTPEFWQPFVERKLKAFPLCVQNANLFFKTTTSLMQAFRWVFAKDQIRWGKDNTVILFPSPTKLIFKLCRNQHCVNNIEYIDRYNIYKKVILKQKSCVKWYEFELKPAFKILVMLYITENGVKFLGKSNDNEKIKSYNEFLPHGQGTWTFPDGSTFSGDDVACHGVPHGKGLWNGKEEVEFEFGKKVKEGHKRRKIEWE